MPRGKRRKPIIFNTIDPQVLLSPDTPRGYCTVAHWWVTEERQAFEILCQPLETLREEQRALTKEAARLGIAPVWVRPSPLYEMLGEGDEAAFPERLLFARYPINP